MFPVDDEELIKVQVLMLWEIASIVDHRPVNSQVVKYFFGDKSGKGVVKDEQVDARGSDLQLAPDALLVGVAAGGGNEDLALVEWRVFCLLEDHTEGDALGIRREDPADGKARLSHGDGDQAVGTGPHKQLPVSLPKAGDLLYCEG